MITISPVGNGRYSLTVKKDGVRIHVDYYASRAMALLDVENVMRKLFANDGVLNLDIKFWN